MANETRDRLIKDLRMSKTEWLEKECDHETNKELVEYVADYLIENGVAFPQWISVKDRLPEENGQYLCADYSKTFSKYFVEVLYFAKNLYKVDEFEFKNKKGKSGFYGYDSNWGHAEYEWVTHWMPLPKPPKAEQKLKEMRGGNESI